ncbi:Histidine decarboxylase [Nibea albiflora]|uniref:Histidine decarboxylase n=1 Tax=Nibea albiflora TaxID=240163 RepID=A0ACB7EGV6_NIBAL|nr:Histidine decarboxylase [Nibea albiflora]
MKELLPDTAPTEPEDWESIFNDIEKVIMPGVVHWQSPHMHAYYPSLTSWASMLGDMLSDAINCIGFTWASSPACTELEMNVLDWLCKALGLPSFFLHYHPDSRGGGVLQSTVSESTLVALLAARKDKILQLRAEVDQDVDDSVLNSRLVAYASDQGIEYAHSFVFNPAKWLMVSFDCTAFCLFSSLYKETLSMKEGLTLKNNEFKVNVTDACGSLMWFNFVFFRVKDKYKLQQTFTVDPLYLRHENSQAATDYMHWQIPLSRRFRSLKLWFVMRSFGLKNIQAHIRHGIEMAKLLESQIRRDPNFELPVERHLGLVVFCLKGGNALTQELLRRLTRSGKMYLIPADIRTKRIIRFTVTSQFTTADDILKDWSIISKTASTLLAETQALNNADQPKSGKDEVVGDRDPNSDKRSKESEEAASRQDTAEVELWIDKAWNLSTRPMRSLSCNSEPYDYNGLMSGYDCETRSCLKDAAGALPTPQTAGPDAVFEITESSNLLGKHALKKLTKFYSVPSFCNQLVQCSRHQVCCPLKASAQKNLTSTCRRTNCMSSSPVANAAPSPTTLETSTAPKLL